MARRPLEIESPAASLARPHLPRMPSRGSIRISTRQRAPLHSAAFSRIHRACAASRLLRYRTEFRAPRTYFRGAPLSFAFVNDGAAPERSCVPPAIGPSARKRRFSSGSGREFNLQLIDNNCQFEGPPDGTRPPSRPIKGELPTLGRRGTRPVRPRWLRPGLAGPRRLPAPPREIRAYLHISETHGFAAGLISGGARSFAYFPMPDRPAVRRQSPGGRRPPRRRHGRPCRALNLRPARPPHVARAAPAYETRPLLQEIE